MTTRSRNLGLHLRAPSKRNQASKSACCSNKDIVENANRGGRGRFAAGNMTNRLRSPSSIDARADAKQWSMELFW
ncbi:hypothetical protein GOP47_0013560 [Adiantum capillus-veneris]|uniref:Uncharacterized protein n=1 Tax=Adiantum capillus-veneris TaxID=13818 RepID=A0A9D4UPA4_ADICA|nr:hypothetical protein GOP47_0013560 [Adiantum capillus-veneris]